MAQAYNHMIMPLAHRRDKYTQVLWGIRDFEHRFGRPPEGMWLPETAVDLETLDIMAELGIRFTILAPHQATKVRKIGQGPWRDVSGGRIDPTTAYLLKLCHRGGPSTCFFMTAPSPRGSLLRTCWCGARTWPRVWSTPSLRSAPGPNWCISPPTGKPTGTIAPTATWPWPMPWNTWNPKTSPA